MCRIKLAVYCGGCREFFSPGIKNPVGRYFSSEFTAVLKNAFYIDRRRDVVVAHMRILEERVC